MRFYTPCTLHIIHLLLNLRTSSLTRPRETSAKSQSAMNSPLGNVSAVVKMHRLSRDASLSSHPLERIGRDSYCVNERATARRRRACKGACTNDVRTERGRGVPQKQTRVLIAVCYSHKEHQDKERGIKNQIVCLMYMTPSAGKCTVCM